MSETSANCYLAVCKTGISVKAAIVGNGMNARLFELLPAGCITEKTAAMDAICWFLEKVREREWLSASLHIDHSIGIPKMAITVEDGITVRILPTSAEDGDHGFDNTMAAEARRIAGIPEPPAREVRP